MTLSWRTAVALVVTACAPGTPPVAAPPPDSSDASVDAASTRALAPRPPPAFTITLARSLCNWVCPAYTVTIRADGSILYDGDKFVRVHGKVTDRINPIDARGLADVFDMANFDGLVVPSECPNGIAEGQGSMRLTYAHGDKTRTIDVDMGNQCKPRILGDLGEAVDRVAGTEQWIRCGKGDDRLCMKP